MSGGSIGAGLVRALKVTGKAFGVLVLLIVIAGAVTIWWFRSRDARTAAPATEIALPRGTRAIELYFPDARANGLSLETREVVEDDAEGDALIRTVVGALLAGPEDSTLRPAFPPGVTLQHVYRDPGGGLYLDFSGTLRTDFRGGSTAEQFLVSSLLRTLSANVTGLTRVTMTSGGQPLATLSGHLRLDGPLILSEWR